ncbi:YkgB family protein [Sorangium sp. So ce341]|uniref:YkgB family protein n=1 Tax=Sorangium sp. So ce341 TaxID=3133302 RepID=UPI003F62A3EA
MSTTDRTAQLADIQVTKRTEPSLADWGVRIEALGGRLLRAGLALTLLWIGGMKFTGLEAQAIRPFIENSPLFAWTYPVLGIQGMSNLLGITEIAIGLAILSRPWSARIAAVGSLLGVLTFLSTLSFLITTPGVWADDIGGFPAIGALGQFLIKDVALLAISVWSLGEALRAAHREA